MSDPAAVLVDILVTEMELDQSRVVQYSQNWKAPKDDDIYITVALSRPRIIGSNNRFMPADPEAVPPTVDREVKTVSLATDYNIEITSKNRDAQLRYYEVLMAIDSVYAFQKMEENGIRIDRNAQIMDLSFIEGSSALHRYRIPVTIFHSETKEKEIIPYENFQTPQEEIDGP